MIILLIKIIFFKNDKSTKKKKKLKENIQNLNNEDNPFLKMINQQKKEKYSNLNKKITELPKLESK